MSLTESTRMFYYLKYYTKHIEEFCEEKEFLQLQTYNNIISLLRNSTIILSQFKIILNTCPEEVLSNQIVELPFTEATVTFKNSVVWSKAYGLINNTLSIVKKLNTYLLKCKNDIPCTEFDLMVPQFVYISDLSTIKTDLLNIQLNISNLDDILRENLMTKSLIWLVKETGIVLLELEKDFEEEIVSTDKLDKKIEKLVENILVVIQNLYKKYTTSSECTEITDKEHEEQLHDEHLKKLLVQNLFDDIIILDIKKTVQNIDKISRFIFKILPKSQNVRLIVSQCVPFLEQIIHLYQYFITQQVSTYRVTCKMTSILLNIFIDLTSKVNEALHE